MMYIYLAFALGAFFIMFEYQRVDWFWGYHSAFLKRLLIALVYGFMGPIGFLAALYKLEHESPKPIKIASKQPYLTPGLKYTFRFEKR